MKQQQYSTSMLTEVLQSADMKDINRYKDQYIQPGPASFAAYMDEMLLQKGLKRQEVFQRADIPQKYGYKLLTGESHTNDRDKLLRLFFAMRLSLKEVRRGLELYGMPGLYPKMKRDAIFMIAFNRGYTSVDDVNKILAENGGPELSRSRD